MPGLKRVRARGQHVSGTRIRRRGAALLSIMDRSLSFHFGRLTHLLVVVSVVVVVLLPEEPVRLLVRVQLVLAGGVLRRGHALVHNLGGVLLLLFLLLILVLLVIFLLVVVVFLLVLIVKVVGRDCGV